MKDIYYVIRWIRKRRGANKILGKYELKRPRNIIRPGKIMAYSVALSTIAKEAL